VVAEFISRYSLVLMRLALAVVFVWFGVLKLLDASPVADLVAKGLPFLPPRVAVLGSGVAECAIGLGLLTGRAMRLTLVLFFALLLGTFLPIITHPEDVFQHNNPLWLSATGEFILKNVVLITAGFTILGSLPKPGSEDRRDHGGAGRTR
jgi:uncharacterized membrane protein YkgB